MYMMTARMVTCTATGIQYVLSAMPFKIADVMQRQAWTSP
jgi:hypothetical protein